LNATKKRPIRLVLFSILVIVLYFAFFPYPLGKELVAVPAWVLDLSSAAAGSLPMQPLDDGGTAQTVSFRHDTLFGYVTSTGRLTYLDRPYFQVALTDKGFINFSRLDTTWIFRNPKGEREFAFSGNGYPLLSRDAGRIFTVKTGVTGISELDTGGGVLWTRDFPCLISSISVASDFVLVGLINGGLQIIDGKGAVAAEAVLGQSRISVVFGCALSRDGGFIAAVSGIDPQYLTMLRKEGASLRVVSRTRLSSDFRREIRIAFSPDDRYIVFEGTGGAALFDPASQSLFGYSLAGGLAHYAFLPGRPVIALLGGSGTRRELEIVAPFSAPSSIETFTAETSSLESLGDALLLGIDGFLLKIDLEEL
jgi:hypothetical protein